MASVDCVPTTLHGASDVDARTLVTEHGEGPELARLRFRPEVCDGFDTKPEYGMLNESHFLEFLKSQKFSVDSQRQLVDPKRPELHYVFVTSPGIVSTIPLRIAILANADEAARALHEAVLEYGPGFWGVHRSNLAMLGPQATTEDAIIFAVKTKLACWGTFTIAGTDDDFVIPGAYQEP
jgi:hypothetical protein